MAAANIGKRLKEFRKNTGAKMPKIASDTGISKENLYKWEKGTKPSDFDEILKLEAYLLEEEKKNMNEHGLLSNEFQQKGRACLAENITLKEFFGSPIDCVVTITEEAMAPDYKPGWQLCLKKLIHQQLLIWGRPYYIKALNNQRGIIRRIMPGNQANEITLLSKNESEYPVILARNKDIEIYEIVGVIIAM